MARTFDGVDDNVKVALGNCDVGYGTCVAILDIGTVTAYDTVVGLATSGDAQASNIGIRINVSQIGFWYNGTAEADSSTLTYPATDGWILYAARKDTGTVAPRFSKYVYSTDTWTHETSATSIANNGAAGGGGALYLGSSTNTSDRLIGDMALVGWFGSVSLSDSQIESLPFSLSAWRSLAPSGLWLLDQAATTTNVIDETGGGANQTSIVGTAVGTSSVPVFSYGASMPWSRAPAAAVGAGPKLQVVTSNLRW